MKNSWLVLCIAVIFLASSVPGAAALGGDEGWITVYCNVEGAAVYFDGTYMGQISGGSYTATVYTTAAPYRTATVERSGYTTATASLTMPANGQTTTVYTTLYPVVTPTPAQYGSIYVSSQPSGAEIYFNGEYRGLSPLTIPDIWPGSYSIRAEKTGYQSYSTTAYVSAGTQSSVYCPLTPLVSSGSLYIISTPGQSNVYLDSAYKGITPVTLTNLVSGTHILEVDHAGYYDWKSTVDVPAGGTRTIDATLNPMPASNTGWIYVSSSPGGASVTLDGNSMGQTPSSGSLKLNNVAVGSHTIVLTRPGYQQYTTTVTVIGNTVTEVSAILQSGTSPSGTGTLSVTSTPPGANVFIDNAFAGISPLTIPGVAAGTHTVSMKLDGYQEYSVTTQVNSGAASTVSAALTPVTPAPKSAIAPAVSCIALFCAAVIVLRRRA